MKTKNDPHNSTPETENEAELPQDAAAKEHSWWKSVKYPDPPYESDR